MGNCQICSSFQLNYNLVSISNFKLSSNFQLSPNFQLSTNIQLSSNFQFSPNFLLCSNIQILLTTNLIPTSTFVPNFNLVPTSIFSKLLYSFLSFPKPAQLYSSKLGPILLSEFRVWPCSAIACFTYCYIYFLKFIFLLYFI